MKVLLHAGVGIEASQLMMEELSGCRRGLTGELVDWSIGKLVDRSMSTGRLVGWSTGRSVDQLANWSIGPLVDWSIGELVDRSMSTGRLVDWSTGQLVNWLIGRLVDWSMSTGRSRLVDWLIG